MTWESASLPSVAILAHRGDAVAVALATLLRRRGRARPLLVEDAALAASSFTHRPDSGVLPSRGGGFPRTDSVALPGGAVIDAGTDLVLCRLSGAPAAHQTTPAGQEYADAESFALLLSWLAGLGPRVVNTPSPLGLSGTCPDVLRLHRLVGRVGLATPALLLTTNEAASRVPAGLHAVAWEGNLAPISYLGEGVAAGPPLPRPRCFAQPVHPLGSALVAGSTVVGAPDGWEGRCLALAEAAGLRVAEIGFGGVAGRSEPVVLDLSPVPTACDAVQLTALAGWLEAAGGQLRAGKEAA